MLADANIKAKPYAARVAIGHTHAVSHPEISNFRMWIERIIK
jgi:hypothetical protein